MIALLGAAQLGHQSAVLSMRTNPEPNDVLTVAKREGPVPETDARRKDWPCRMYLLDLKAGMEGVPSERAVGVSGPALNALRELSECRPKALVRVRNHIFSESRGVVRPAR